MGGVIGRRQRLLASGIVAGLVLAVASACTTSSTGTPAAGAGSFLSSAQNATNDNDKIFLLQQALQAGENAYEAYSGLGAIYLRQADTGSNRVGSLCSAVASYASAAQASSGARRADSLAHRADALLALSRAGATSCAGTQEFRSAADFQTKALAEYQAAITAEGSPARHFALASAYRSVGRLDDADAAYTAGLNAGASGSERAAALAAQAEVWTGLPLKYTPEQVRAKLEEASAAGSNSPQVNLALGQAYLRQGDTGSARSAFERARSAGGTAAAPGQANPTAEAYYYLSVLDTLGSPSQESLNSAVRNIDAAIQNGGRTASYQRQACFAYIARGVDSSVENPVTVYTDAVTNNCPTAGSGSAEDALLHGLSQLRLAQYAATAGNEPRWRERLTNARSDFARARQAAEALPESSRWVQLPGRPNLWIWDLQNYGDRLINVCLRVPVAEGDVFTPQRTARGDIEGFYRDYRLNLCRV